MTLVLKLIIAAFAVYDIIDALIRRSRQDIGGIIIDCTLALIGALAIFSTNF